MLELMIYRLIFSAVAYYVIGIIVERMFGFFLEGLGHTIEKRNTKLAKLMLAPPWRSSEIQGIFFWPSTMVLLIWGAGLALWVIVRG